MKHLPIFTCLALFASPAAFAEEQVEAHGDVKIEIQGNGIVQVEGGPDVRVQICRELVEPEPATEPIPAAYAEEKTVCIKIEKQLRGEDRNSYVIELRLINPTDKPVTFTGFSEKSPITQQQQWKDGQWVDQQKFLRCGTGLRPCTIEPGQSALFSQVLPTEQMPARIGVACADGTKDAKRETVWSDKIEDPNAK